MNITITPGALKGSVDVPASKSFCHRIMICSWLADRAVREDGLTPSKDILATAAALSGIEAGKCRCGESGSTLRFLMPVALALGGSFCFTGEGRLMQRPMEEYKGIFTANGIEWTQREDGLYLCGKLKSGEFCLGGDVSSQYVTGLLLALPLLAGDSSIRLLTPLQSKSYVDITLRVQQEFGVDCAETQHGYYIRGGQRYMPAHPWPEADFSQAAFWMVANALGSDVQMQLPKHSVQGDSVIADILSGGITRLDISDCPDLAPVLAVWLASKGGRLENCARLRYKESDRIAAIRAMLAALGGVSELNGDGLIIEKTPLTGGVVDSFNDHRIAMAAGIAASTAEGPVTIMGAQCVEKSYPSFWDDYKKLGGKTYECNSW